MWDTLVLRANREFFLRNLPFCQLTRVTFFKIPVMYSDKFSRICGKGECHVCHR